MATSTSPPPTSTDANPDSSTSSTSAVANLVNLLPTLATPPANLTSTPSPSQTLPPPQTFDFLPLLHTLISKLATDEIDARNVSSEANPIRVRLSKARAAVAELPDVGRTLAEQEADIQELEERVRNQRDMMDRVVADIKAFLSDPSRGASSRRGWDASEMMDTQE